MFGCYQELGLKATVEEMQAANAKPKKQRAPKAPKECNEPSELRKSERERKKVRRFCAHQLRF